MPELMDSPEVSLLDRRDFTLQLVLAVLSAATVTVVPGCGDNGGNPPAPSPGSGDIAGTVTANHGHRAVITSAELSAGNAVTLNIRGDADHPHTASLTASQVMQIAQRQRVSVESTSDAAHTHTVIFN
jgi:hypothetical protein